MALVIGHSQTKYLSEYFDEYSVFSFSGYKTRRFFYEETIFEVAPFYSTIVVMTGANDIGKHSPDEITTDLTSLCQKLHSSSPSATIIVIEILPRSQNNHQNSNLSQHYLQKWNFDASIVNLRFEAICKDIEWLQYLRMPNFHTLFGIRRSLLARDGLHLSPEGTEEVVRSIEVAVGKDGHQDIVESTFPDVEIDVELDVKINAPTYGPLLYSEVIAAPSSQQPPKMPPTRYTARPRTRIPPQLKYTAKQRTRIPPQTKYTNRSRSKSQTPHSQILDYKHKIQRVTNRSTTASEKSRPNANYFAVLSTCEESDTLEIESTETTVETYVKNHVYKNETDVRARYTSYIDDPHLDNLVNWIEGLCNVNPVEVDRKSVVEGFQSGGGSGNKLCVFMNTNTAINTNYAIELLEDAMAGKYEDRISEDVPVKPKAGEVYVINREKLNNKKDAIFDRYCWINDGTKKYPKGSDCPKLRKSIYKIRDPEEQKGFSTKFQRHTYLLTASEKFIILQYIGDEKVAKPVSHGLSKSNNIFIPTKPSVIDSIKNAANNIIKTKTTIHAELTNSAMCGSDIGLNTPRNEQQVANHLYKERKKHRISQDSLYNLLEISYHLGNYVLQIDIFPSLVAVVGMEEILTDFNDLLKSNVETLKCCIDTTYKLGELFVTVFSYQNVLFESNPAIPVAFMLHEKRDTKFHERFMTILKQNIPNLGKFDHPIICDREPGIKKAIKSVFPNIQIIHCWNHITQDVKRWLKSKPFSNDGRDYIGDIRDILHSTTDESLHNNILSKSADWPIDFKKYFDKYLASDIKNNSMRKILDKYDIYQLNTGITSNAAESLNNVLKAHQLRKQLPTDMIVMSMYTVQKFKYTETQCGRARIGKYKLKKKYDFALIDPENINIINHGGSPEQILEKVKNDLEEIKNAIRNPTKDNIEKATQTDRQYANLLTTDEYDRNTVLTTLDDKENKINACTTQCDTPKEETKIDQFDLTTTTDDSESKLDKKPEKMIDGNLKNSIRSDVLDNKLEFNRVNLSTDNEIMDVETDSTLKEHTDNNLENIMIDSNVLNDSKDVSTKAALKGLKNNDMIDYETSPKHIFPDKREDYFIVSNDELGIQSDDIINTDDTERTSDYQLNDSLNEVPYTNDELELNSNEKKSELNATVILDKSIEERKGPEKLLTQEFLADKIIRENRISFVSSMSCFVVEGLQSKKYLVNLNPKETCSCPSMKTCYHLIAVKRAFNLTSGNNSKTPVKNVSQLRKNSKPRAGKTTGQKKPKRADFERLTSTPSNTKSKTPGTKKKSSSESKPNIKHATPKSNLKTNSIKRKLSVSMPSQKRIKFSDEIKLDIDDLIRESSFEIQYSEEETMVATDIQQYWIKSHNLSISDKLLIENGGWLNDKHMNAVNSILRKQLSLSNCLQSTLNIPYYKEKENKWNTSRKMKTVHGPSVQIHFNGSNHWLASFRNLEGEIFLIDSLKSNKSLNSEIKIQLCQLYADIKSKQFYVTLPNVQQQQNGSDCGLFAIAFITEILHSNYTLNTNIRFQIPQLRTHLISCIENEQFKPFPKIEKMPKMPTSEKNIKFNIYCFCRLPACIDDLIFCENKKCLIKWYHLSCVDMSNATENWVCDSCSQT